MIKIENLNAFYGPIQVLHDVNIEVKEGEIVALIGSNGAGKTTTLNAISGHVKLDGKIQVEGNEINGIKPHKIACKGIIQVPEGRHVFPGLTVEQNILMGSITWSTSKDKERIKKDFDMIYKLFPRLQERRKQSAWSLSGGEQQMLAVGRALMSHPKILLLDEPSMGLAPIIIDEMFKKIKEINELGTTVLIVEQNAKRALDISDRAYLLERGKIVLEGNSKDIKDDPRVREAYLGKIR